MYLLYIQYELHGPTDGTIDTIIMGLLMGPLIQWVIHLPSQSIVTINCIHHIIIIHRIYSY